MAACLLASFGSIGILNTYVEELAVKKNANGDSSEQQRTKALSKMISSNEIVTLINALGLDPKVQEIDLKDLRYGKIIIMTDADVDGSHIRALLLTFFNNKPFNKLIENGHVYLAQPPLFKINKGSKGIYIKDEKELEDYILKHSKAKNGTIKLEQLNGNLQIIVFDNGIGFNENIIEANNGIGLSQVKARLKILNGLINIKSTNEGTRIFISVPIVY